jgi:outer membrane protein assembly factor BamB
MGDAHGATAEREWNGYRGADRTGVVADSDWSPWEGDSPDTAWAWDVGKGYSAVVIYKGRAFTMGNCAGTESIYCLDAETGEDIWVYNYPCEVERKGFFGPRSTPAVDDDYVFSLSWTGQIHCVSAKSGELVWSKTLPDVGVDEEFGYALPNWGLSCSPLIYQDTVIYDVGRLVALDRATGDVKWATDDFNAAYSSPALFMHEGTACIAAFMRPGLVVVEAANGNVVCTYPWKSNGDVNAAMPVIHDGRIFVASYAGPGCALLNPTRPEATVIWQNTNLANNVNSSVLYDGHLYGFQGQVSDSGGELRCVDVETGEIKWRHEGLGVGALSMAGGRLLVLSESGDLIIATPNPGSFQPLVQAKVFPGRCWTQPTFADGRIFCRNSEGRVVCIDVRNRVPRGFVGDSGSGWDTRSAVSVKASSEKKTREAIYTIDGSGLDPTGRFHTNYLYPTNPPVHSPPYPYERITDATMWLSGEGADARGGTVAGGEWVEFSFDEAVPIDQMWIWNYNENNHVGRADGVPPHYYWPAAGMRDVVIQYSAIGGTDPGEWKTIYDGEIGCAYGQAKQAADLRVDFGGAEARFVVITSKKGGTVNWTGEKVNRADQIDTGLSEVRFYPKRD